MALVFNDVQIDGSITGLRNIVRTATTVDLGYAFATGGGNAASLTGPAAASIGGVVLALEDRVLVKDQTNSEENGIYDVEQIAGSTILRRASDFTDFPTPTEALERTTWITEGTNAHTAYTCTSDTLVDNVTPIVFVQYDVTNTLSVPRGGTGNTSFTLDRILIGNGTSPIAVSAIDINDVVTNLGASTDNAIARFDGTSGILIQNSGVIIDDSNNMTGAANIGLSGNILDANGNELIVFSATASAINEITITNAAIGTNPQISASGNDTNISLNFLSKGTGVYNFLGNSATPATLSLFEDTDNGTNSISIDVPSSVTADYTLTLPATLGTTGQILSLADNAGNLQFSSAMFSNSYMIQPNNVMANSTTAGVFAYFAWDNSQYTSYNNGTVIFWYADVTDRNLIVDVFDGSSTIGTTTIVAPAVDGIATFSITNPVSDVRLQFRASKSAAAGVNPNIFGTQLEFTS